MYSLREIQDDDHPWLVSLHNDPVVLRNLTNPKPITLEDHMRWWNSLDKNNEPRLIFDIQGKRAGLCKFYGNNTCNNDIILGADLHKDFRGQGHSIHMWRLMLKRCFDVHKFHRASLTTAEYNDVARHVYKKLGFKEEGRLTQSLLRDDGKYYDQVLMYMLREDWESSQK